MPTGFETAAGPALFTLGLTSPADRQACGQWLAQKSPSGEAGLAALVVEDLVLVWAALQGKAAALQAFDRRLQAVCKKALSTVKQPPFDADELAQRLRARLLVGGEAKLAGYSGRGALVEWLRTAATLEWMGVARKASVQRTSSDDDHDAPMERAATEASPEATVLRSKDRKHVSKAFREALDQLEPQERTVLRLRFVEGLSTDEIGQAFAVHRTTASRWLEAAQKQLLAAMRARLAKLGLAKSEVNSLVREVAPSLSLRLSQVLRAPMVDE